jgi:tRNA-dihydrouridine synthase B
MLCIGRVQLESRVLLAPIAGHCDLAFRLAARSCGGVGLAFTDLLCPHGVLRQNSQTQWLMATCDADRPLGMQLYGNDAPLMAKAARWAVDQGATTLDINMGCPVDKVTKTWAGSMMLCTPDATVRVAEAIVAAVGDRVPVTAKTRLGYRRDERTAVSLVRRLVSAGIAGITIHGRTAEQRFKGAASLEGIAEVVGAVHEAGGRRVPCIGNGDIRTPFDAQHMIRLTGCDGVMIARAALGAPWIFRDTHDLLTTGRIDRQFTLRQRLEVIKLHYRHMRSLRTARWAVSRIRACMGGYGVHLGPCKPLKQAVQAMTEADADRFEPIVDVFLDSAGDAADQVPVTWEQREQQLAASISGDLATL